MVNNDYCNREIAEIIDVENEHLSEDDKHAVLHRNAKRFYNPEPPTVRTFFSFPARNRFLRDCARHC
jgi:hypothetical protein